MRGLQAIGCQCADTLLYRFYFKMHTNLYANHWTNAAVAGTGSVTIGPLCYNVSSPNGFFIFFIWRAKWNFD
jgi:hypothetical protein